VLLRDDGAALLQHRDNKAGINHPDTWVPPGGHCEAGEAMDACARREFFEETGYRLDALHYLTRFLDDHDGIVQPVAVTVFWSRYDGVQQPVCREGQALGFVPRARAAELKVPGYLVRVWDQALEAAARAGHTAAAMRGHWEDQR
jgi:8-oxo-dGTP pyrophosphatase MutT (NUDIX family)